MLKKNSRIPARTIERMVLYKRLLSDVQLKGTKTIFSHELSDLAKNTSAQVRRDLMTIGLEGCPHKGYDVAQLINRISQILGSSEARKVVLVGIGNLGRAILSYFSCRHPGLTVTAAFDNDPEKCNRVIAGCRCYPMERFNEIVTKQNIRIGIITVPVVQAQNVADLMVASGMKGILNFAPVPLNLPDHICSERLDIASTLEKLAYYSEGAN